MNAKLITLVAAAGLMLAGGTASAQFNFTWGGQVQGEDVIAGQATGTASFDLTATTLTLTLTNTSQNEQALGHLLSGFVWDQSGFTITSGHDGVGTSADIAAGSSLVGPGAPATMNLSGEWAWSDMVAANWGAAFVPVHGTVGDYGVSATGADGGFGAMDRFDINGTNYFGSTPPDGPDGMIIGPDNPRNTDGLPDNIFVENQMIFTWTVSGVDGDETITNGNAIFGTDGAFLVPEPSTAILLGGLIAGFGLLSLRRMS